MSKRYIKWNNFWMMLVASERNVGMRVQEAGASFKFVDLKSGKSCKITKNSIEEKYLYCNKSNAEISCEIFNDAKSKMK